MKLKFFFGTILFFTCFNLCAQDILHDFDTSLKTAGDSDKHVLMVFSGSDWCKPCIRLKQEILLTNEFQNFSEGELVILEVDFPYKKKNRLSKEQQAHNDQLAEKYNPNGTFPKVVLLNPEGQILGVAPYRQHMKSKDFIANVDSIISKND